MASSPPLSQERLDNDDRGGGILAVNIVLAASATIAVVLRLCARKVVRARIMADDYLIILALGLSFAIFGAINFGLGRHAKAIGPATLEGFYKFSFGYDLVYNICLPTIKFSILLFYARIFPSRRFRIALWITGSYVMAWFIWNFFGGIFLCDPPAKAWNSTLPGHCVDTVKVVLASAAVNISADVIILCLPMYTLWRLQVSRGQKVALTGIFLLGGFVCVASLVRLLLLTHANEDDITWTGVDGVMWSSVEPCVGIVSACLPTMRPLFRTMGEAISSRYHSRVRSNDYSKGTGGGSGNAHGPYSAAANKTINDSYPAMVRRSSPEQLAMGPKRDWHETWLRHDSEKTVEVINEISFDDEQSEKRDLEAQTLPTDAIKVDRDVDWSEEYREK